MAFASVGTLGNIGTPKTSGTTSVITTGADAEVGNVIVVLTAWDNTTTTDSDSTNIDTVTDTAGNTYVKVAERTESSGSAADGTTTALFMCEVTTQLDSGDTITVTADTAAVAKASTAWEFTKGAGTTLTVESFTTTQADGSEPADAALAGLTSREYLWVHAMGQENTNVTITQTGWTPFDRGMTTGGGSQSNQQIGGGFQITTATGITATVSTNSDTGAHAYILAAIYEAAGGTSETPTPGGATVSGSGPVARVAGAFGGATVSGAGANVAVPSATGGVTVSGAGPAARVDVTPGGAVVSGTEPTDSAGVSETPTPGGAVVSGTGPAARAAGAVGGATVSGTGPTASAPSTTGGATAGGVGATARVTVSPGGAVVSGTAPTDASGVTETPVPGGATASGTGPTAKVAAATGGTTVSGAAPGATVTTTPGGAVVSGSTVQGVRVTFLPGGATVGGNAPQPSGQAVPPAGRTFAFSHTGRTGQTSVNGRTDTGAVLSLTSAITGDTLVVQGATYGASGYGTSFYGDVIALATGKTKATAPSGRTLAHA